MILIAHRGNIDGPDPKSENHPNHIMKALHEGYDVEIDVWFINSKFMLGHDSPQYEFPFNLLERFYSKLWIHCKNLEALIELKQIDPTASRLNYFWHQEDDVTLTSKRYIWAYPGKQPINNSIAVMPELNNDNTSKCVGICSDYIKNYK